MAITSKYKGIKKECFQGNMSLKYVIFRLSHYMKCRADVNGVLHMLHVVLHVHDILCYIKKCYIALCYFT